MNSREENIKINMLSVIHQVFTEGMVDKRFTLIVRMMAFNQFRIQICGLLPENLKYLWEEGIYPLGHGDINFNLWTYKKETAQTVLAQLQKAEDVIELVGALAKKDPEGRMDRIRLDDQGGI